MTQFWAIYGPMFNSAFLLAGLTILWKGVRGFIEMRKDVNTIMTNHLPHMYEELQSLRKDFTQSLIAGEARHRGGN